MPTVNPTAPGRAIQFVGLGLDSRGAETATPRYVTVGIDGQSMLTASVSDVSLGPVRLCIFREDTNDERECKTVRNNGALQKPVVDQGYSTWTVSVIGWDANVTPFVTLTVAFNANSPSVHIDSFRYNGSIDDHYNGFEAVVQTTGAGDLSLQAAFDDGNNGEFNYHAVVWPKGGAPILDETSDNPQGSLDVSVGVDANRTYHVSLLDPDEYSSTEVAVFVAATLSWP